MKKMHITILGASGLVGQQLQQLLKKSHNPHTVKVLEKNESHDFKNTDIVFLCTPSKISEKAAKLALEQGARVIDLSSHHRDDPKVPLIIPEVNFFDIREDTRLIANPNCIVNILLPAIYPLHQMAKLEGITLATYQAASGAGKRGLEALETGRSAPFKTSLKNNLFCHESRVDELGFCEEENKIIEECRKILHLPKLAIEVRSVRVPIERCHSIALWATFNESIAPNKAKEILEEKKGIVLTENANPLEATGRHEIFVSSIRQSPHQPNTLEMFIVGDQLLKGAALNALSILERLLKRKERC